MLALKTLVPVPSARIVTANTGLPDAQGIADDQIPVISERMRAYYESLAVPGNPA